MKSIILSVSSLMILFTIIQKAHMQAFDDDDDQCFGKSSQNDQSGYEFVKKSDKANLYNGQQAFTISLLRAINKATPNENVFFSPYSTYHALLLAYFGSANDTEKQLKKVLHLDWAENKQKVINTYKLAKKSRDFKENGIEFASADKIFVGLDTPLRHCIKQLFADEIENMNFLEKPDECLQQINNWVKNVTRNEIPEFLSKGDVTSATNIVLANAAYFKGQWETKFIKENTKMQIFHSGSEKRTFVDMMNNKGMYYLGVSDQLKCHILELPYKGEKREAISMMIFLPPFVNNGSNLEEVLEKLTPESLLNSINDFESREIKVGLPKFDFEQRLELVPILNEIGINDLFSNKANLQTFSNKTNLSFGDALHVAKIKVDEEGSTASAATALFSFRSARPLETTEFICDHPFLFLIYDHKSKAILFAGIYRSP